MFFSFDKSKNIFMTIILKKSEKKLYEICILIKSWLENSNAGPLASKMVFLFLLFHTFYIKTPISKK